MNFNCPVCQVTLEVADDRSSEQVFCRGCGTAITPGVSLEIDETEPSLATAAPETKICPMCGATIKAIARKCRFCGENVIGIQGADSRPNHGVWRDGNLLVMTKGAQLPYVCVKTNEPAEVWLRRKLYWHSSWIYLLALLSIWIYIIVALIVREKADIQVGLCQEQLSRRRWAIAGGWLAGLLGLVLVIAGIANSQPNNVAWLMSILGLLLFITGAIAGNIVARIVAPTRITKRFVWLKGVNLSYLGALPAFPGED